VHYFAGFQEVFSAICIQRVNENAIIHTAIAPKPALGGVGFERTAALQKTSMTSSIPVTEICGRARIGRATYLSPL
jgi:hypothetical protein